MFPDRPTSPMEPCGKKSANVPTSGCWGGDSTQREEHLGPELLAGVQKTEHSEFLQTYLGNPPGDLSHRTSQKGERFAHTETPDQRCV